ncbi:MAG: sigma-54 dependent transcriptional regulator, partial [Glaciecola sp.]
LSLLLLNPDDQQLARTAESEHSNKISCCIINEQDLNGSDNSPLKIAIDQSILRFTLARENQRLNVELNLLNDKLSNLSTAKSQALLMQNQWDQGIVRSPKSSMNDICDLIEHVAPFDISVVISGESGTGKQRCAKAIHANSLRREAPFVVENCGAISEDMLASELFGHKKGAYAGASHNHEGLFLQANGGTLFLDEISNLSPNFQLKLLRVLQEGAIKPLGSSNLIPIDVRVIVATSKDLLDEVKHGRFREELYYYLSTFILKIPALRERQDDVVTLAKVFLQDAMRTLQKRVTGFASDTLFLMQQYQWPGNVRELQNEIKRMLVLANNDYLTPDLLSANIQMQVNMGQLSQSDKPQNTSLSPKQNQYQKPLLDIDSLLSQREFSENGQEVQIQSGSLKDRVESLEARILQEALIRHRWNKTRTANELGLSRVGLRNKLERYCLSQNNELNTPVIGNAEVQDINKQGVSS